MCVCVAVCVLHVSTSPFRRYLCMCTHGYRGQRPMSDASLHCHPSYFLGQGLSPNNWTRLTCQQVPGGLLSSSSQSYDYKDRQPRQLAAQVLMLARQTLNQLRLLPSAGFFIAYAFPLRRSKGLSVLDFAGNSQLLLLQDQDLILQCKTHSRG